MSASTLDIDRFRKVHTLIAKGATDGERAAAFSTATTMAKKAGMTLAQAVSKLNTAEPEPKPADIFSGFDDYMEAAHPGYKREAAEKAREREARYAARRAEILAEFGTVKAFFDPTPEERLLQAAAVPFITKTESYVDPCGTKRRYCKNFAGITSSFFKLGDVNVEAITAVKTAYPFPTTVRGAFDELRSWERLNRDRAHFYEHHEYYFDLPIELRIELLRQTMKVLPATSWDDLDARFQFKAYDWEQQWTDPQSFNDPEWARVAEDVRILRQAPPTAPVQSGQPETAKSRRSLVLSILDTESTLSDREIARRAGVSPTTVGNLRRKSTKLPDNRQGAAP